MQDTEKLAKLKIFLGISGTDEDILLSEYLEAAAMEILQFKYSYAAGIPLSVDAVDEMTQIWSVVAGYNLIGMENQKSSTENTIARTFEYSDMIAYIRAHVIPIVKVVV